MRLLPALINITIRRQATTTTINTFRNFLQVNRRVRSLTTINSMFNRPLLSKQNR